jgi:hypothetical protein
MDYELELKIQHNNEHIGNLENKFVEGKDREFMR